MRRVLDDDEAFRRSVAASTGESELGRAAWLFVDRPEGWEEELQELQERAERSLARDEEKRRHASLLRRVADLEGAVDRVTAERDAARVELAEARSRLGEERRQRHQVESDAGRLRQRVAALEAERRNEEEKARAADRADAERRILAERVAELERALDGQVRRVADLEAAATARELAAVQSVDRAALERAVAAAVEAVSSASAALEEATSELEVGGAGAGGVLHDPPLGGSAADRAQDSGAGAGTGRRAVALPPAVYHDSEEAATFLVRVPGVVVLVDGYNVTKLARPELALSTQREWLAGAASGLAARTGAEVQLVFDGAGPLEEAPADRSRRQGVQIRFSADGVEADDVIIELVRRLPADRPIVVATSDRRVRDACRAAGANTISATQLLFALGVTPRL